MNANMVIRLAAVAACCFVFSRSFPQSSADDAATDIGPKSKNTVASERIVLEDIVYRLELQDGKLCLNVEDLSTAPRINRLVLTNYEIPGGGLVSQIELTNFRDKGLLAALKIKRDSKAEFVELAFWSKAADGTIDGKCSSHQFLSTDTSFHIMALSSRRSMGVFVVVGKADPPETKTEGYLFLDGCPWPCMGGALTKFEGFTEIEPAQ